MKLHRRCTDKRVMYTGRLPFGSDVLNVGALHTPGVYPSHTVLPNVMKLTQEVYSQKARELEAEGKLREAEKMYCTIKQYDLAIGLYKQHSMWDQVIRLVSQHRKVCHRVVNSMLFFCCQVICLVSQHRKVCHKVVNGMFFFAAGQYWPGCLLLSCLTTSCGCSKVHFRTYRPTWHCCKGAVNSTPFMQLLRLCRVMHAQMTSTESNVLTQFMLYAHNFQDRFPWRVCV